LSCRGSRGAGRFPRGGFRRGGLHWASGWLPGSKVSTPESTIQVFVILVIIRRSGGGFHAGWTPKNPALTLAICRAAPPSIRKYSGRNRNFHGLADSGESFSGQPVTVCPRKTVSPAPSEKAFDGASGKRLPPRTLHVEPLRSPRWTPTGFPAGFRGPPWGPPEIRSCSCSRLSTPSRALWLVWFALALGASLPRFIRAWRSSRKRRRCMSRYAPLLAHPVVEEVPSATVSGSRCGAAECQRQLPVPPRKARWQTIRHGCSGQHGHV
jgi:hypothetical protein